jgi:hypothetical protein
LIALSRMYIYLSGCIENAYDKLESLPFIDIISHKQNKLSTPSYGSIDYDGLKILWLRIVTELKLKSSLYIGIRGISVYFAFAVGPRRHDCCHIKKSETSSLLS